MKRVKHWQFSAFALLFVVGVVGFAQETKETEAPFMFLIPAGYDYTRFGEQTIHTPATEAGFLLGEQNQPFTEVERRFMGLALYQPYIFSEEPLAGLPRVYHRLTRCLMGE